MNSKKNLKRNLLICLLAGSAVMYTLPLHAATSVIANNTLPSGGSVIAGDIQIPEWAKPGGTNSAGNLEMNITQNSTNGIISWGSFDVGGSATVNFKGPESGYNTLNYVNGGNMSQIYGTINANNNGNIFIVNPAGVQIGNSAQINVGSLHVSNGKVTDEYLNNFDPETTVNEFLQKVQMTNAALMSLGNINANKVTFEGDGRIVIDSERIKNTAGDAKLTADKILVNTKDKNNVVIGYEAYDETDGYGKVDINTAIATVNGSEKLTKEDGYMWVEDVEQLQAINTNLSGNYALRNSIDATSTEQNDFTSIGSVNDAFKGKFDGIDYNIFGLTIKNGGKNTGLFGYTNNATISNVTLVGGSITGSNNVGAIVGNANNTTLTNVVNSAAVSGDSNVGGIVGSANNSAIKDAINTGTINGSDYNVGGLIGNLQNSKLDTTKEVEKGLIGNSYNLGDVSGNGHNVGGLVGSASNSTIGDDTNLVYNRMDVTGAYNVGGIVGNMTASTVQNAENSGTVLASGSLTDEYNYHTDITDVNKLPASISLNDGIVSIDVNVANVGGIAGSSSDSSTIKDVTNTGDVSSGKGNDTENVNNQGYDYEYYTAGNVGGIVGSAVDTNITNATNRENEIRGAHNVGGVVGYFSGTGTIDKGINDGGDIMATGARNADGFVMESVRQSGDEDFIIGNIGGIVGYMEGNDVKVTGSANRGTIHTENITDSDNVLTISKAANVGGIVGKIDANTNEAGLLIDFRKGNYKNASVSNSYNTGNVTGYTGVGGVIGMMYNGSVAGSYNQGAINTTRQVDRGGGSNIDPLNMGGIVGDTTEQTNASAVIYDVYNEGQIGDENFEFYARHVGGIVGRLSGTVEKAYNTGDIYNNDTAVGGIVGWWYKGNIKNVFNTGNITVRSATELQVGGIAGAAEMGDKTLENAYNLGTIRGYKERVDNLNNPLDGIDRDIYVGGIIGRARGGNALTIRNVYTMGNLYAGVGTYNNATGTYSYKHTETNGLGAIYGGYEAPTLQGANYIVRDIDYKDYFKDLSRQNNVNDIEYGKRYSQNEYEFVNVGAAEDKIFSNQDGGAVNNATDNNWRIYEDSTTPILNAFLPNVENYFDNDNNMTNINTIQYGTAYNPLLTIIKANGDLSYDWNKLGISGAASLAVYGGGLTLDNVDTSSGNGYYSGLLYTDKDLTLIATNKNNEPDETKVSGDIGLGSGAELYGSSVKIEADGTVTVYGSVTATGETADLTGDINITAGDVDVYGTLTTGKPVSIAGIEDSAHDVDTNFEHVNNPNEAMIHISERFAHEINSVNGATSNITINAGTKLVVGDDGKPILDAEGNKQYVNIGDGNVNLYFGNKEQGLITTEGDLTVTGTGDVYVDSDLDIGGDLKLEGTGAESEVVLDITNIGEVQKKNDNTDADNSTKYLHDFLEHFANTTNNSISFGDTQDAKITVDMWNGNTLDLTKFNNGSTSLVKQLGKLKIANAENKTAQQLTHIWVSNGEQLKGIQNAANSNDDVLSYNFALKNDVNASDLTDYEAIGTGATDGFTGTFDGRGNRIIGLDATQTKNGNDNQVLTNAGIFSTVGDGGVVKDVNIYSGTFTGTTTAGAVAGVNNGRIEGIVTFGNTVTVTGNGGNAGGIAGTNSGTVDDVESSGSVIAGGSNAQNFAGGLVGTNNITGIVNNSFSNSAVTASSGSTDALGGVVGVNSGEVSLVDSLGITNGGAHYIGNVGGIIGTNSGKLNSAYNESIVSGYSNVGGIIGNNSGTVSNIVNASSVDGLDINPDVQQAQSNYVGGLVGSNSGSVTNGRNNGTITGTNYVGGLVGNNASEKSVLTNLVNDSSASIIGVKYVGGIAGSNAGTITTGNEETDETVNLINRGTITGQKYVGGVVGSNSGTITNANNDVELNVKNKNQTAQYFGGIAGENTGTINNATNSADVNADGATYVGGIVGYNTKDGKLQGMGNSNEGRVEGASYVGGVIGYNEADIGSDSEDIVEIKNSGTVVANDGGAGGIIGVNNGDVTNANLISEGVVTGTDSTTGETGTGGIFGINNGDITNSTLENTNGTITGVDNTGGLIGINNGDIQYSSLKNTADITVAVADDVSVSNIGGLIGKNTGIIEGGRKDINGTDAGYYKYQIYNNGTITVTGSGSNIGGLIGNNAKEIVNGTEQTGSLTAGYNTGAINAAGSENVGGIAGSNSGKIDQVFNTVITADGQNQTITGGTNVGGLVGNNRGTLSNAYNTTAVSGNANVGNAVGVNDGTNAKAEFVYDVTNTGNKLIGENINSASVKNSYTSAKDEATADGTNGITYISADKSKNKDSYKNFADGTWKFYDGNSNPLLKVFLTNLTVNDSVEIDGKQVTLNEYLKFVYDADEQDLDIADLIEKGFITAPNKELLEAYKNTLKDQSNGLGESYLLDNTDGQVDAGTYDNWLYSDQIASGSTDGSFNPNNLGYDITFENKNNITIDKATINIDLNDIYHTYGDINNVYSDNDRNNHASYEDSYTINNWNELDKALQDYIKEHLQVSFNDDDDAINGNKTQSVGDYDWSLDFTLDGDKASNYQIGNGGQISNVKVTGTDKSHVEKAKIAIGANNEEIHLGETPDYTGTDINGVLVNGDSLNGDYNYGIAAGSTVENEVGRHENVIGVWIDGTFYDLSGNVDWTKVDGFFANYDITVKPGTLTVTEQLLPDIPQDWPHNRWDYLFNDAPFDRNKDFRERKAEVNFVDGGMEI